MFFIELKSSYEEVFNRFYCVGYLKNSNFVIKGQREAMKGSSKIIIPIIIDKITLIRTTPAMISLILPISLSKFGCSLSINRSILVFINSRIITKKDINRMIIKSIFGILSTNEMIIINMPIMIWIFIFFSVEIPCAIPRIANIRLLLNLFLLIS